MSWVIRSPSCSQIRMSRARSLRSGKSSQHLVEQVGGAQDVAAGLLEEVEELAVARCEDARQAHRGPSYHGAHVEPGLLDAGSRAARPALAHGSRTTGCQSYSTRRCSTRPSSCSSAYAARRSPSNGIPTLPGLTSSMPSGVVRSNGMCVWPKTTRRRRRPRAARRPRRSARQEADHVRAGRAVAEQRAVVDRLPCSAASSLHELVAEQLAAAPRAPAAPARARPASSRASARCCRGSTRRRARRGARPSRPARRRRARSRRRAGSAPPGSRRARPRAPGGCRGRRRAGRASAAR